MIVLKATQAQIVAALQAVAGIVERRHTLPILANVMLKKSGDSVELTTSDLEIQIRTQAALGGDKGSFSTTVGARKLMDILRSMPADQSVSLESQQNKLLLKSGKSRFTLQTLPAEDFPLVQESSQFGPVFSVPQQTLKSLLLVCELLKYAPPPTHKLADVAIPPATTRAPVCVLVVGVV